MKEVVLECLEDEVLNLVIVNYGEHYARVFLAIKEITGKTTKEVKELLKKDKPVILQGSILMLNGPAIKLQQAGAEVKFCLSQ